MSVILVFIDGVGLGEADAAKNPYVHADTPLLDSLMGGHRLYIDQQGFCKGTVTFRPLDAALGVAGLPQSATGQTAIWTGINAPRCLGKHLHGLPNQRLKEIIEQHNIYRRLQRKNIKVTFANAYRPKFFTMANKHISVSTYAAQSAGLRLRTFGELVKGEAVYQDITRQVLVSEGYDLPLISPGRAAAHLLALSSGYDFTLFEYFQSDIAGHRRDKTRIVEIWRILDDFLKAILQGVDSEETLLLITSDHGNMEDISSPLHTHNPVPLIAIGRESSAFKHVCDLTGIAPVVESILAKRRFTRGRPEQF